MCFTSMLFAGLLWFGCDLFSTRIYKCSCSWKC